MIQSDMPNNSEITTITPSVNTIIEHNDETPQYEEAQIPLMYYEVEKKLILCDNKSNMDDCVLIYNEVIILWKQCIENKISNWRNNKNIVSQCFKLHKLFMEKCGSSALSWEYVSLFTHILSNSSNNKERMNHLLNNLKERRMLNMLTFELLISSCYNEYTGSVQLYICIYIFVHFPFYEYRQCNAFSLYR